MSASSADGQRTLMGIRKSYLILGRLPASKLFDCIKTRHSITHIPTTGSSRAEIIERISSLPEKSYTFLLVLAGARTAYPIDQELVGSLHIECVCNEGAGYDSIDVDYFTSRGSWVANSPNAVRIPTAEWAVALILTTTKGLGVVDKTVKQGHWRQGLGLQNNISGMTLGIIGLGAIGKV